MFLDPELTLSHVVKATGIRQKTISAVLNQHAGKSFNEFVNQYRIEELKKRLLKSQSHLTITGIAFECGFNSQATFQRTFKQFTGVSPTEFLAQQQKKS
jgi:AraC-like DNA-binding protein